MKLLHNLYRLLASSRLAIGLLVAILSVCVLGVTLVRGRQAWEVIFSTLWFNGLLVLLVINTAVCFFGRMWRRRITVTFAGMILFHLSFVAMLGGVIYDSLYAFEGMMRLTEGETLHNNKDQGYDSIASGRFFDLSSLRGETTLLRVHRRYIVDGRNKGVAYEIALRDSDRHEQGRVYLTHSMSMNGLSYFNDREGYSLLLLLYDDKGNELHGAHVPLQSMLEPDQSYRYVYGTLYGPETLPFPEEPQQAKLFVRLRYLPDAKVDRAGHVDFSVWNHPSEDSQQGRAPDYQGRRAIGQKLSAGRYQLAVVEVRYWAGMIVKHHPGNPIVLTSLWVAFAGLVLSYLGRLAHRPRQRSADGASSSETIT